MHKLRSDSLKAAVRELSQDGIYNIDDLAAGVGYTTEELQGQLNDDIIRMCGKIRIQQKAKLNRIIFIIADAGSEMDLTRVNAAKYLLAALHDQSESGNYFRQKLKEEKTKRQINQTIQAAKLSTEWDESTTLKFIESVRQIGDVLQ